MQIDDIANVCMGKFVSLAVGEPCDLSVQFIHDGMQGEPDKAATHE